jgi:hypothetical protein
MSNFFRGGFGVHMSVNVHGFVAMYRSQLERADIRFSRYVLRSRLRSCAAFLGCVRDCAIEHGPSRVRLEVEVEVRGLSCGLEGIISAANSSCRDISIDERGVDVAVQAET